MSSKRKVARIERRLGIGETAQQAPAEKTVVDPKTFVEDPELMNASGILYPEVLKAYIELNSGEYNEAILTGGIGSGKTTLALFTIAYQLYLLSRLEAPHKEFSLSPSSEIVFIFQSATSDLARNVDYSDFKRLIMGAPYFRRHFRYDRSIESELRFPNRIVVRPVSGRSTAALGQNVMGGVIDEMNFMETVERSKRNPDGGEFDQAGALYSAIARRRASRFMKHGNLPGILCLISSRRYPGQFTDRKEEERRSQLRETGKTPIYLYDKRVWDIKPSGTYCGETFNVFIGDLSRQPRILDEEESLPEADRALVLAVPVEYCRDFEADLVNALRDIAGVASVAMHPFLVKRDAVSACFGKTQSVLDRSTCDFETSKLRIFPKRFQSPELIRFAHLDLSLTGDATGVVVGHVANFVQVDRSGEPEVLPRIRVDFALQVRPPKGGEVRYDGIRALIYKLRELGMELRFVSADSYQSADTLQQLEQKRFVTWRRSIDNDPRPYEVLKAALYDGRVELPEHDVLHRELLSLERDLKTGKVDHPPRGSKDLADALAGVVFGLSYRREVWFQHGVNPYRAAPGFVSLLEKLGQENVEPA
jgi:hypothetical protein